MQFQKFSYILSNISKSLKNNKNYGKNIYFFNLEDTISADKAL